MKPLALALLLLATCANVGAAQDPEHKYPEASEPVEAPGPPASGSVPSDVADLAPGDRAPDFHLDGTQGLVRLAGLAGHWSVIVFAGGHDAFASFAATGDSLTSFGADLYAICQDGTSALANFATRRGLRFPLLSDPTGQVSQLFGMYDDSVLGIQPGLVIVDQALIVRMVVQGPALHADDVLMIAKHTIRGT